LEAQITVAVDLVAKETLAVSMEILFLFSCKNCWTHMDIKAVGLV
jgi:hypothetical protein